MVEHPFGVVKRQWGHDHVLMKGLEKTGSEISLVFLCYNIMRVMRIIGINGILKAIKAFSKRLNPFPEHFSNIFKANPLHFFLLTLISQKNAFLIQCH